MAALKLLFCLSLVPFALGKGSKAKVECTPEVMKVTVPMDGDRKTTYLEQLKAYQPCLPTIEDNTATYLLDLQDPFQCGVTRVLHTATGQRHFYHTIVIEDTDGGLETVAVRCLIGSQQHTLTRRDVSGDFPVDLDEPEVLDITLFKEGYAPIPYLVAVVKQNGKQVSGEISVSPGTPLAMQISLDNSSAAVYGALVSYMHVTDTGKQQETIIFNGCSVDPYLFQNFETTDGDILEAKFKAFKFPDTTYVQFKGTVTVCLDKCIGVECSNGATGYGRRRRSIASADANKLYEVALTTFIKVDWAEGQQKTPEDVIGWEQNLKAANQKKVNEKESLFLSENRTVVEEIKEVQGDVPGKSNYLTYSCLLIVTSVILTLFK